MKHTSWRLNRRELLKGGGVALALPLLNRMQQARGATGDTLPARMLISYFAYGAYMPGGTNGVRLETRRTTTGAGGPAEIQDR